MWILLLIMLAVYSYWDIREKQLPVVWVSAGIAVSVVLGFRSNIQGESQEIWQSIWSILGGMLPGGMLVLMSLMMKGIIGCADGLVLMIVANMVGIRSGLLIWIVAMGLSFVYSCLLLIVLKKKKSHCFPFVPFYFLGTLAVYCMGVV